MKIFYFFFSVSLFKFEMKPKEKSFNEDKRQGFWKANCMTLESNQLS